MEQTEIVDKCLSYLIKVGLYKATSRELSLTADLNKSGLYYYFKSKDDVILACAERAIVIISESIMFPTIKEVIQMSFEMDSFLSKAKEMTPMMNFLIQVHSENTYHEKMLLSFSNANDRYQKYAERLASNNNFDIEKIKPYISLCITTISNYMIFGDDTYLEPQFSIVFNGICELCVGGKDSIKTLKEVTI